MQQLAGAREVADTTLNIPHPYVDGIAEAWIGSHADAWERKERLTLAITSDADGVVGAITLRSHWRTGALNWVTGSAGLSGIADMPPKRRGR